MSLVKKYFHKPSFTLQMLLLAVFFSLLAILLSWQDIRVSMSGAVRDDAALINIASWHAHKGPYVTHAAFRFCHPEFGWVEAACSFPSLLKRFVAMPAVGDEVVRVVFDPETSDHACLATESGVSYAALDVIQPPIFIGILLVIFWMFDLFLYGVGKALGWDQPKKKRRKKKQQAD